MRPCGGIAAFQARPSLQWHPGCDYILTSYHGSVRRFTVRKFSSFEEAEQADREQYRAMTARERLELISQLRALRHGPDDAAAPRLERVLRITELERS